MADEFHPSICGGAWWNSMKHVLTGCSPPCYTTVADMGSFGHGTDTVDIKARSHEESIKNPVSDVGSIVLHDHPPSHRKLQQADSNSGGTGCGILMDSTSQMMGFDLPSSATSDWNLSVNGRTESYNLILEEDIDSRLSYRQETGMGSSQILKNWSPKSYSIPGEDFPSDQPGLTSTTGSGNGIATCLGLSTGFPIASVSYEYPSTLLQSLFESDSDPRTPQQSLFNNRLSIGFTSSATSPLIRPSLPEQQPSSLQFSNYTPFWNASATAIKDVKAGLLPSPKSQFSEEVRNLGSAMKKGSSEPAFKRPKLETPSPLPTFKVRKEKLGDRITALQQLVSPFGKTDTASVLYEAIEYIKFLHDQVNVLSTPYMKQAAASIQQEVYEQRKDELKDPDEPKQDLRSRGLCLVPVSNTFPVTNETTIDFWTPTFGGTLR
ncbi:transcription factor bHLH112-like [Hibiscus syriacus]|uniref:transcription factor bHLH112-like n=1 Tax=Hibiscus syriacus TaxID=106335 RepID=UPI0019216E39|nr:transcription factor bHLH112-like [Hibiscus syriacus]